MVKEVLADRELRGQDKWCKKEEVRCKYDKTCSNENNHVKICV